MKFNLYLFFCLVLSFNSFVAQSPKNSTIESIRALINQKDYSNAEKALSINYKNNPEDLETIWLYAQVAHWNSKNNLSETLFQKAITLSPKNTAIQLDYGRMLYESGALKKALNLISKLTTDPQSQAEALVMQANINFWNGNIIEANAAIDSLKKLFPNTTITTDLEHKISDATALLLKTNFECQSDNQPMTFFAEKIELSHYQSWLWSPKIEFSNYNFNPTQSANIGKFGTSFYFAPIGLAASISAGAYKNYSGTTDWIGTIDFNQKITKNTSFKFGYNKKPYLGTLVSTTYNITQNNLFGDLDYRNPKLFSIHGGYNYQYFKESNSIQTLSTWVLSKPITFSALKVQFGYGFSHSDAKTNLYTSKQTLAEYIANYNSTPTIDGYYNPYFTPKNQNINMVLLLLNYSISKNCQLEAKGNYGFSATCQNPYIYLNTNSIGNPEFTTNYTTTSFHPFEISSALSYPISIKIGAKATFIHQETFFYNRNNFNLGLNFQL